MPPLDATAGANDWVTAPAAAAAPSASEGKDDWITAPAQHWAAPAGGEFGDLAAQASAPAAPQGQVGADINAVGQGLVSGTGAVIAGAGRIAQAGGGPDAQRMLASLDLVDQGKNVQAYQKLTDEQRMQVASYIRGGPDDKRAQRDALQQTITDYSSGKTNAAIDAGTAIEGAAPNLFPVDPANEGIQTGVGRMIGGAAPALAAGAVGGPVGVLASLATIGSQAYDGAYQDAVAKGASHEQADDAAGKSALAQSALMVAPVGRLLQRVPVPLRDGLTATLVNLGQHGVEFGTANALGTFANNYVASQTYDPGRSLTQGTGNATLEGAIAGLIIPAAHGMIRGGARTPAATVDDVMAAPDVDSAIAAAGKAAQAPMQVDTLNWGDLFTPKTLDGAPANDTYSNPRARVPTAIDTPAFMPPGSQVPASVIEATRPDFIPPAPPAAPEVAPDAARPLPLTQVTRQGTTAPGTNILNSNGVNSPTRAANDVNPLLPPPANDAEAYPAWNASRTQQPAGGSASTPAPAATAATPMVPAGQNDSIVTPSQTVPGGFRQSVTQSVGAAASRDNTLPADIAMAPDEFAANRAQGEIERLAAPPVQNDKTVYIPGTKPTLAETTGNPQVAMDQAYNRQQPEAMTQHIAQENQNADAVANYYADTAGSAQELLRMERARDATAAQNIQNVFGDPKSTRPPADPSRTISLMDGMLNDPRQAERNSVVKILSSLSEKFYDADGELKTDPYALYGIGEHINDLLRGTGDTETNSAARVLKRELMQIKGSLYNDIEDSSPGFAQYRADYQRDSQSIDAMKLLQDERLSLLSGTNQHITPAKWFTFMRGIVQGRADPMDPASSLSEDQMDRLWNITDQLKRSTFIDAGKPRGSWTSMMQEFGGKFARLAAHGVAAYAAPVIGNLGVEMGVAGLRKRSVGKEMNRVLNPDLGQQPTP